MALLKSEMFAISIERQKASINDLFPDWNEYDRFGLVIDEAFGGIGATHLLQVAMTAYYDVKASRRSTLTVYPEIYAFHIGRGFGSHAHYDFWPARREVILKTSDHREVLDAINDRGITRLAVPDRAMKDVVHRPKEEDAAFDRISSAFVYDASGRTSGANVTISGLDRRTEFNPTQTLRPLSELKINRISSATGRPVKEADDTFLHWITERDADVTDQDREFAKARRAALKSGDLVEETYRRVSVAEALKRLASAGIPA
ncbi:hypothetical protein QO002_000743 [Pararhizobium capsulatum DSM 1112]|uniref:Uncharacterized protein n=1 Tax=Pararhizobium capsulatum DSM 1112 TaxID=1121113 RepID=A0ABU0BMC1_9HYPH|nr:hypothetical protein [Pararhizobium capsulatum]MDQ0318605.1 hypothetical protein [Pararhizobium capsulatum DSM 1112]